MELSSKNRAKLRALASQIDATAMVGINGLTDNVVEQVKMDFNSRELVKVKVLRGAGIAPKEAMEKVDMFRKIRESLWRNPSFKERVTVNGIAKLAKIKRFLHI